MVPIGQDSGRLSGRKSKEETLGEHSEGRDGDGDGDGVSPDQTCHCLNMPSGEWFDHTDVFFYVNLNSA